MGKSSYFFGHRILSALVAVCLMISMPFLASAETSNCYCSGEAEASEAVAKAAKYGEASDFIVSTIVNELSGYDGVFYGSKTEKWKVEVIISNIRILLDDPELEQIMINVGFEPSDENKNILAEEVYLVACIYYDEAHGGGTDASGRKLACIEVIRFAILKLDNVDSVSTAEFYYDLYQIYLQQGEAAALDRALEEVAIAHSYAEPTWTWSDDCKSASATFACENCTYAQTVTTTNITTETTDATCDADGEIKYSATVTLDDLTKIGEKTVVIPAAHTGDPDKDHQCNGCGEAMGVHEAAEGKHTCDYCNQPVSECIDEELDHECDICGEGVGVHEAAKGTHICEYCDKAVSECADFDQDHYCDVCGEVLSECADENPADQICDICGKEIPNVILGDADGNNEIDASDATLILQYCVGLIGASDFNLSACDLDGNDTVDASDATLILQYCVGLITKFPVVGE